MKNLVLAAESGSLQRPVICNVLQAILDTLKGTMTEAELSQRLQDLVLAAESGGLQRPVVINVLQGRLDSLKYNTSE